MKRKSSQKAGDALFSSRYGVSWRGQDISAGNMNIKAHRDRTRELHRQIAEGSR